MQGVLARRLVLALWVLAFAAIPVWIHFEHPGWDPVIYLNGLRSLEAGHDPYADAIAIQQTFHSQLALHPNAEVPYSYVYSPITLPVLRLAGRLPLWMCGSLYWLAYVAAVLAQIWAGMQFVEADERRFLRFFAPVAAFFPGLLASDIVLSGNVVFLLYASVLLTAISAWRSGRWRWFYIAVLAASCVKAPLLTLAVIPLFSAARQRRNALTVAGAGVALFVVQPLLWPSLFRHYLQAVELQFSFNRDFGCGPAGLFSGFLFDRGVPYAPLSYLFYLAYAIPLLGFLSYLSRRLHRGGVSLEQWAPVLLLGVILLNPRVLEYDLIPLAVPMALIAWRFFRGFCGLRGAVLSCALLFGLGNAIGYGNWEVWKLTEGTMLMLFFAAGSWTLLRLSRVAEADRADSLDLTIEQTC